MKRIRTIDTEWKGSCDLPSSQESDSGSPRTPRSAPPYTNGDVFMPNYESSLVNKLKEEIAHLQMVGFVFVFFDMGNGQANIADFRQFWLVCSAKKDWWWNKCLSSAESLIMSYWLGWWRRFSSFGRYFNFRWRSHQLKLHMFLCVLK